MPSLSSNGTSRSHTSAICSSVYSYLRTSSNRFQVISLRVFRQVGSELRIAFSDIETLRQPGFCRAALYPFDDFSRMQADEIVRRDLINDNPTNPIFAES